MIYEGINPLGCIIFVFSARESAYSTEKYGKRNVRFKMMRTNECRLDVGDFVIMFHVVESSLDSVFQRPFVIGNESVSKAPFFLQDGSATMLALCSGKGGLYGLAQFCIDDILGLLRPLCFLVDSLRNTCLHKLFDYCP